MEQLQLRLDPEFTDDSQHWLAFTPNAEDGYCQRRFLQRFGKMPERIKVSRGLKLAGPIATRSPNLQARTLQDESLTCNEGDL